MKLVIEINMDNAAFENHNGCEAGRILYQLAVDRIRPQILEIGDTMSLMDHNGNKVGEAKVVE